MAQNKIKDGKLVTVTLASVTSGSPAAFGKIVGVAVADTNTTTGKVVLDTEGIFEVSVKGVNGGGNVAINNGDAIYLTDGDTPKLNAKTTGVLFGYAYSEDAAAGAELVAAGATTTIKVIQD